MKSVIRSSALIALLGISLSASYANTVYFNTANGDWAVASNWYNSTQPTVSDTAVAPSGTTLTISTSVITGGLLMGGSGQGSFTTIAGTGTVNLINGGTLQTYQGGAQRNQTDTTSIFNMSGGTCNVTGYFEVGNSTISNNVGIATISGGTLTQTNTSNKTPGGFLIGTDTSTTGHGTLIIQGNSVAISGTTLVNYAYGTLKYKLGATGISAFNLSGNATFSNGSTLLIDGSDYTGGASTFTLLTSSSLTNSGAQIQYTGFGAGLQPTVNIGANTITLTVAAVPEASSVSLLGGLAAVGLLLMRK